MVQTWSEFETRFATTTVNPGHVGNANRHLQAAGRDRQLTTVGCVFSSFEADSRWCRVEQTALERQSLTCVVGKVSDQNMSLSTVSIASRRLAAILGSKAIVEVIPTGSRRSAKALSVLALSGKDTSTEELRRPAA